MFASIFQRLKHHFRTIFDTEAAGRLIVYSPLVGIVAGLGAVVFFYLLMLMQQYALGNIEGYFPPPAGSERIDHAPQLPLHWWAVLLVPTVGGLVCGMLVYGFAPEAEGHGTDAFVQAFHRLRGKIRARVPFVKTAASIITIGTGGSAGREGPIAQIGAGFGSFLATWLGHSDRDRRLLMLAGAAGGIGAIFRAPLGGALFISEVLYSSTAMETLAVIPCFIASITAYTVFSLVYGTGLAFKTPSDLHFHGIAELPFYLVFAILLAVMGYFYVLVFYGLRDKFFRKLPIPNFVKPAIGGLLLGCLALWYPQLMSGGYGWIQQAIDGKMAMTIDGDSLRRQNPGDVAHHLVRRQRRRFCAVALHRRHAGRRVRARLPSDVPDDHYPTRSVRPGRHGRLLRRRGASAAHGDADGLRDERQLRAVGAADAGVDHQRGHPLFAVDALRRAGVCLGRQPGPSG